MSKIKLWFIFYLFLDIESFQFFFQYCLDKAYLPNICKNEFSAPEKAF